MTDEDVRALERLVAAGDADALAALVERLDAEGGLDRWLASRTLARERGDDPGITVVGYEGDAPDAGDWWSIRVRWREITLAVRRRPGQDGGFVIGVLAEPLAQLGQPRIDEPGWPRAEGKPRSLRSPDGTIHGPVAISSEHAFPPGSGDADVLERVSWMARQVIRAVELDAAKVRLRDFLDLEVFSRGLGDDWARAVELETRRGHAAYQSLGGSEAQQRGTRVTADMQYVATLGEVASWQAFAEDWASGRRRRNSGRDEDERRLRRLAEAGDDEALSGLIGLAEEGGDVRPLAGMPVRTEPQARRIVALLASAHGPAASDVEKAVVSFLNAEMDALRQRAESRPTPPRRLSASDPEWAPFTRVVGLLDAIDNRDEESHPPVVPPRGYVDRRWNRISVGDRVIFEDEAQRKGEGVVTLLEYCGDSGGQVYVAPDRPFVERVSEYDLHGFIVPREVEVREVVVPAQWVVTPVEGYEQVRAVADWPFVRGERRRHDEPYAWVEVVGGPIANPGEDERTRDLERRAASGDRDAASELALARIEARGFPKSTEELVAALPRWRDLERLGIVVRVPHHVSPNGAGLIARLGTGYVGDGVGDGKKWWGRGHPDPERLVPGTFHASDGGDWLVVVEPGASQEVRDRLAKLALDNPPSAAPPPGRRRRRRNSGDEEARRLEREAEATGDREAWVALDRELEASGADAEYYARRVAEMVERRVYRSGQGVVTVPLEGGLDLTIRFFPERLEDRLGPHVPAFLNLLISRAGVRPARGVTGLGWAALVFHRGLGAWDERKLAAALVPALAKARAAHAEVLPHWSAWTSGDRSAFPSLVEALDRIEIVPPDVPRGRTDPLRPLHDASFELVREELRRILASANRNNLAEAIETGRFETHDDTDPRFDPAAYGLVDFPRLGLGDLRSAVMQARDSTAFPFGFAAPASVGEYPENAVAFAVLDKATVESGDVVVIGARAASPQAWTPAQAWPDELPSHYWDLDRDKMPAMTDEARRWARRDSMDRIAIPARIADEMAGRGPGGARRFLGIQSRQGPGETA